MSKSLFLYAFHYSLIINNYKALVLCLITQPIRELNFPFIIKPLILSCELQVAIIIIYLRLAHDPMRFISMLESDFATTQQPAIQTHTFLALFYVLYKLLELLRIHSHVNLLFFPFILCKVFFLTDPAPLSLLLFFLGFWQTNLLIFIFFYFFVVVIFITTDY